MKTNKKQLYDLLKRPFTEDRVSMCIFSSLRGKIDQLDIRNVYEVISYHHIIASNNVSKGSLQKKTSYLVTLSKRGGRGQNEITILGALEIMTSLEGRGGLQN